MRTICCFHHVFQKQFSTIFKVNFVTPKTIFTVKVAGDDLEVIFENEKT